MEVVAGVLHSSSRGRGVSRGQGQPPLQLWGRCRCPCPAPWRWGHAAPHSTWTSQICVGRSSAASQMMAWSRS